MLDKKVVLAVNVNNVSMSKTDFDSLCDKLNYHRLSHDYRIVSDYAGPGYWQSCTYSPNDRVYNINDIRSFIEEDVNDFIKKKNLPSNSVRIDVVELDGGKING